MKIIEDLLAYAEQHGTFSPFHRVAVQFQLNLSRDGSADVRRLDRVSLEVPQIKRQGVVVVPYMMYDDESYVLDGGPKFDAFWDQTCGALRKCGDRVALAAVEAFLGDASAIKDAKDQFRALLKKTDKGSKIALSLDDEFLVDRPRLRAFFLDQQKDVFAKEGPDLCMVTGRRCHAVRLHPSIRGVPGTGIPVPLISFEADTSRQSGFGKGTGCLSYPMSPYATNGYTTALNDLLRSSSAPIDTTACVVCWGPPEARNIAQAVSPYTKREDREAVWRGIETLKNSESNVHLLFLKGSQGRIAILHYDVLPARDAATSLLRFEDHFGYVERGNDGRPTGRVLSPSIVGKLQALGPSKKNGSGADEKRQVLSAITKAQTIRAILTGEKIPESAMRSIKARLSPREWEKSARDGTKAVPVHAKCQLDWIEFDVNNDDGHYVPKRKIMEIAKDPELKDYLIDPRRDPYRVGVLISLEQAIRSQAHSRDVGGGPSFLACVNPAAGFRELGRKVTLYRQKLKRHGVPFTRYTNDFENIVGELKDQDLVSRTRPMSDEFKAILMLGYEHAERYVRDRRIFKWKSASKPQSASPDPADAPTAV